MSRIGARSLLLAIDGTDYTAQVSRVVLVAAEDQATPRRLGASDYAHGGMRSYTLTLTTAQDAGPGSLWSLAWARAGELVDFHMAPYGNPEASEDEPHFTGQAWVVGPDGDFLGGEANKSPSAVLTADLSWPVQPDTLTTLTEGSYPGLLPEGW